MVSTFRWNLAGGIIIGNDFLTRYYIHMDSSGFMHIRQYMRLIFKEGLITKKTDLSKEAALIRTEIDEKGIDRANISSSYKRVFRWITKINGLFIDNDDRETLLELIGKLKRKESGRL